MTPGPAQNPGIHCPSRSGSFPGPDSLQTLQRGRCQGGREREVGESPGPDPGPRPRALTHGSHQQIQRPHGPAAPRSLPAGSATRPLPLRGLIPIPIPIQLPGSIRRREEGRQGERRWSGAAPGCGARSQRPNIPQEERQQQPACGFLNTHCIYIPSAALHSNTSTAGGVRA